MSVDCDRLPILLVHSAYTFDPGTGPADRRFDARCGREV
jgi:hypothetical protein